MPRHPTVADTSHRSAPPSPTHSQTSSVQPAIIDMHTSAESCATRSRASRIITKRFHGRMPLCTGIQGRLGRARQDVAVLASKFCMLKRENDRLRRLLTPDSTPSSSLRNASNSDVCNEQSAQDKLQPSR